MESDYQLTLRREFEAEEGSFLLKLRGDLEWDCAAFARLVEAMQACCCDTQGSANLARWQAEGFWYLSWFVRSWISHPNFPRVHPEAYYERALERLDNLAYWYFIGERPFQGDAGFEPL